MAKKTANEPVVQLTALNSKILVVEKFSKVVQLTRRIKRVDGFDPEVIDVTPLGTKAIRVHALAPGVTSLTMIDEASKTYSLEIFVTGDVRHLQAYITKLFPKDSVRAVEVRDAVLLSGWVTQPEHITELVALAEEFYPRVLNQMRVGGEQQVLLRVKIMEAQRSKIRKMGFNFLYVNRNAFLHSAPGALAPLGALAMAVGGQPSVSTSAATLATPTISFGVVNDNNAFLGFLEALKEEALLKILAEPELISTHGRPANMHSGGEFPILVPQSLGNVSIEFRKFGVSLEAVPIVLGNGRVRLELKPEVSEKDFSTAVRTADILVPGLKNRSVNTSVEMKFGETLMIAGLIQNQQLAATQKVPVLGDIPYLGAAFSRKSYTDAETELVIMVTPELVGPMKGPQVPPGGPGRFTDTPTDRELYLYNQVEVPKFGERCENCPPAYSAGDSGLPGMIPGVQSPGSSNSPSLFIPGRDGEVIPAPNQKESSEPALPPLPADKASNKTAGKSSRRSKYELPIWARDEKSSDFNGPDPGKQVGFTKDNSKPRNWQQSKPAKRTRSFNPKANRSGLFEPKPGMIQP